MSVPSKLLYVTNSGATTGSEAHLSLIDVTARAAAVGGLMKISGARVVDSPANTIDPFGKRAYDVGLTSVSTNCGRPSRVIVASAFLKPRATIAMTVVSSIHRA